jgi:membrane protease YdiL (CAAX protease family)
LSMSYALGWLTLQAESVWPAALAHGFYNVWIYGSGTFVAQRYWLAVAMCWGALGFLLFRYRPPPPEPEAMPERVNTTIEPEATGLT